MSIISVIVPVYGTEKYVKKCINSILDQTYTDLELLVVNDASQDYSKQVLFEIATNNCIQTLLMQCDADTDSYIGINGEINNTENDYAVIEVVIDDQPLQNHLTLYFQINKIQILEKYYNYLDQIAQEYIYNREMIETSKFFSINEFYDIEKTEEFSTYSLFDMATIQTRGKSYAITSDLTRIKYIEHLKNEGLFQARLSGYEYANGDYIATVDSDDYIGIDYLRLLWKKSIETGADVVVSEMIRENLKVKYKGKRTHSMIAIRGLDLFDEEISDYLFASEGELSPLWFVWGKLYRKTLWDKCYSELLKVNRHQIMLEDMMYGTVFTLNAHHYVYCDADTYFYVVNESASTTNNGSPEKLIKNLSDVFYAFDFIKNYLIKNGVYEKYNSSFELFKEKWSRTWFEIQNKYDLTEEERADILKKLSDFAPSGNLRFPDERDVFFYNTSTPWDSRIEMLKKKIVEKELISFDIFDTLVLRPFWKPSDLFILLNSCFISKTGISGVSFSEMRIESEKQTRNCLSSSESQLEEVSIDEIYQKMQDIYGIAKDVAMYMQEKEEELEIEYCQPRVKIRELYELAKWLGKRIVFVSDMYLSKKTIIAILKKCGYIYEDNLYLSSDYRVTKISGKLFSVVLEKENVEPSKLIHIGDNWTSDGEAAQKLGIEPWRTPKPIDLFMNNVADHDKMKIRGNYGELLYRNLTGSFIRYSQALDYYGIRCMYGMIANRIFDNPYDDWELNTDFNRNPYNVGYMALGMHDFGIVQWLINSTRNRNNSKIHFVARDGFLAMKIYDIFKQMQPDHIPDYDYFYMSRKSFLPLTIESRDDWWSIKENINYKGKTVRQILSYYKSILPECGINTYESVFKKEGLLIDFPLENETQYILMVKTIQKNFHRPERIAKYRGRIKKCLTNIIKPNDIMFDIGYSGRAQAILSRLLGYPVDAYYVHTLNERSNLFSKKYGFHISTYYDYSPALTGKIRELVQSESSPSCIGYNIKHNELQPVFENKEWRFHEKYVVEQLHKGAVDFTKDFLNKFSKHLDRMTYRKTDISMMHEKFLLMPGKGDMEIFELFHFEDDLFFNMDYQEKWLIDIWNGDLNWNHLPSYKFKPRSSSKPISKLNKNTPVSYNKSVSQKPKGKEYVPYKLVPEPPIGIINRIKYFKNNDHIILKKYMMNKGDSAYRLFNSCYNFLLGIKQRKMKQNKVGNLKADFTLNANGKVLYNATSSYGLLCCIIHKLIFHQEERTDLMLSSWRKDKYDSVVKAGFFNQVFIWSDMAYRDMSYAMDKIMKDASEIEKIEQEYRFFTAYEKLIPFKVSDYRKIVIAGNSMPFGDYLERNEVTYSIIEDGAGLYCDYSLLQHSIDTTYPLIEQYMNKKYQNLQGGVHCENIYINCAAQKKPYDSSRVVDFAPVSLLDILDPVQKKKIFDIYSVRERKNENNKRACLLLTYPLAQREHFTVKEEKMCYALLADIFGHDCEEVHIKAHPDDRTDFTDIDGLTIINRNVLSELLWYETKTKYVKAIATVSTSMNNLLCIENGITFGTSFCKEYKNILRYFVIVKMISMILQEEKMTTTISGKGVYDDFIKALVEQYAIDSNYISAEEKCCDYMIVDNLESSSVIEENKKVISLGMPERLEGFRHLLLRKWKKKKYDFIDTFTEDFYITHNIEIKLPLTIELPYSGMKIQLCEEKTSCN